MGRGNEGRNFFGFNYRMSELQGAVGLAQLRKLPMILSKQRANKGRIKEMLAEVEGVTFRTIPDPDGDTATFLAFMLPDAEKAATFNKALADNQAGAVYFYDNTWHYHRRWEHLHEKKTVNQNSWPFKYLEGRTLDYSPADLPASDRIMSRLLVWQINYVNMSEDDFTRIRKAVEAAAMSLK